MLRKSNNSTRDDASVDSNASFFTTGDTVGIEVKNPSSSGHNHKRNKLDVQRKFKGGSRKSSRIPRTISESEMSTDTTSSRESTRPDETVQKVRPSALSQSVNQLFDSMKETSNLNKLLIGVICLLLFLVMGKSDSSGSGSGTNYNPHVDQFSHEEVYRPEEDVHANYKSVYSEWENRKTQKDQIHDVPGQDLGISQSQYNDLTDSTEQKLQSKPRHDRGEIGLLEPPASQEVASAISALYDEMKSQPDGLSTQVSQMVNPTGARLPRDPLQEAQQQQNVQRPPQQQLPSNPEEMTLSQQVSQMVNPGGSQQQNQAPYSNIPPPIQLNPNDVEEIPSTSTYVDPVPQQQQQQQQSMKEANMLPPSVPPANAQTIAYVLPIYECPETQTEETIDNETGYDTALLDAAAILKYAIHRASKHNSYANSKYDYQMIAIIHPDANQCYDQTLPDASGTLQSLTREDQLQSLGYKTYVRTPPVNVEDIEGEYLRSNIHHSQKSGAKDLIRLHAYTLEEYPVVVLLDLRSLIMKALDDIVEILMYGPAINNGRIWNGLDLSPKVDASIVPTSVEAFFTRDYSSVSPQKWQYGIHPGLIVLRPSMITYNNLKAILKKGDYQFTTGWGGSGIGNFPGSMTTKGILAYYYDSIHQGQISVELNRCVYNSMADSPYIKVEGQVLCRNRIQLGSDGKTLDPAAVATSDANDCEDCRLRKMKDLKSVNLSVCKDPWTCFHHMENMDQLRLCRNIHALWYALRNELEENWVNYGPWGQGTTYIPAQRVQDGPRPEHFLGYCKSRGSEGYIPMVPPVFSSANTRRRYLRR